MCVEEFIVLPYFLIDLCRACADIPNFIPNIDNLCLLSFALSSNFVSLIFLSIVLFSILVISCLYYFLFSSCFEFICFFLDSWNEFPLLMWNFLSVQVYTFSANISLISTALPAFHKFWYALFLFEFSSMSF